VLVGGVRRRRGHKNESTQPGIVSNSGGPLLSTISYQEEREGGVGGWKGVGWGRGGMGGGGGGKVRGVRDAREGEHEGKRGG